MSDYRDVAYAAFGAGFGVWGFFWGFKRLRRKRMVENIPTSTVRSVAMGLAELVGTVEKKGKSLLKSPLTNTPCVFYRYLVEKYVSSGKSGHWRTVAQGDSSFYPFWLKDTTGKILVYPQGAEFLIPCDYRFQTRLGTAIPGTLQVFLKLQSIPYGGFFGSHTLRFREWYITEGETVYVLGTAQKNPHLEKRREKTLRQRLIDIKKNKEELMKCDFDHDGKVSLQEWDQAVAHVEHELLTHELDAAACSNPEEVVIAKGEDTALFMISDTSQDELLKKLKWQSVLGIYGGAAMSVVLLWYILFRLGVL